MSIYLEKLGLLTTEENNEQTWGKRLEPVILQAFRDESGYNVGYSGKMVVSTLYPWMHATLDGCRMTELNSALEPVEIKNSSNYAMWAGLLVPEAYYIQVQHQIAVLGGERGHLVALIGGSDLRHFIIERNDETIKVIVDATRKFFRDNVATQSPPDYAGASPEFIKAMFPLASKDIAILPGSVADAARRYALTGKFIKYLEGLRDESKAECMAALGEHKVGYAGEFEVRWPNRNKRTFDSTRFQREHPELYQQYLRDSSYRQFGVKEPNEDSNLPIAIDRLSRSLRNLVADIGGGNGEEHV